MKNKSITLKRFFACVMVIIMAVTAVPMSGFAGIGLLFRANALSTDANGELVITAGETANVWVESYEITYLKFVPTASGVYTFTSLSYDYDTYGYLYDSDKNQLTYNNDGGSEWNFQITYELRKDTTYYWGVGLRYGDCDSFDVRLSCDRLLCEHENTKDFDTVAASCTTDGCTAGVYCEDCETWLSGHTFIPAHHTYTNTDTVCDVCGEAATEVIYSGDCGADGSNVTFTQYKGGLLVFSGSGSMCNFGYDDYNSCGDIPYHLDLVSAVIIGDRITRIGSYAFDLGVNISAVSIPDSVTEIGSRAFHACRSLTQLSLSDSVVAVGDEAFSECYALSDLTIGKNVTSIGHSAFSGCRELTSIAIPDSVTRIGDSAFYGCIGLTSLTIGNSVTTIGHSAFYGCTGLTSIAIPDSTTVIYASAFYGCTGLASLTIGNSVTTIGGSAFYGCAGLTSIEIPDSVTSIGDSAFYGCTSLTSLTIGKNVATIEESAFSGCTALTRITWNAQNVCDFFEYYYCDDCVWHECGGPHERIKSVFDNAGTSGDGVDVVFGDEVESIPAYAFCGCTDLTSLTIGKNVASIGKSAFSDCTALTIINWNAAQVADLFYYAYDYDEYVLHSADVFKNAGRGSTGVNVVFSDNVERIPAYAFYGCTGLTYLTIGKNVTTIGNCAFSGCTALSKIDWNAENVSDFEENNRVFYDAGNAGGIDVIFDDSVISIPAYAFYSGEYYDYDIYEHICVTTNVKSITIGKNVTAIGNHAFAGCKDLAKINWNAENVSDFEHDSYVFYDAGKDTDGIDVVFGDSVTSIPAYAFSSCTGLTSLTIGKNVTSIGNYAFSDCTGLTSLTVGNSVTAIGNYAFSSCTGLTSLTVGNSVTAIGNYAFSSCTGLTSLTIGKNVTSIGNYAFSDCTALSKINWNAESVGDFEENNRVFDDAGTAGGIDVVFGDSVTSIPAYAFCCGRYYDYEIDEYVYDTANIKSVTMSDSVKSIGKCAFNEAAKDALVFEISDNLEKVGKGAFDNTSWLEAQPYGDVYAGKVYYTYKGTMPENTSIVIKDGTKGIAGGALASHDNLSSITIPASVTNIGADAFDGDYYEDYHFDVNIRDLSAWCRIEFEYGYSNPLRIAEGLYLNGQEVTDLEIPDGVTEIKDYAFYGFDSLRSVKIPASVTSIGARAFYNCYGLTTLTIPGSVKTVGNYAFSDSNLSNVSIENGVEKIGEGAFSDTALRNVILPDSVTEIGSSAFSDCSLSSVTIGNGVETVPEYAFSSCSGLRTIKIGRNLKTVEANAFSGLQNFPEIFFAGSEAEWKNITIDKTNDMILRATMYYNADIAHEHSYTAQVTTPATCTQSGVKTFTCDCGRIYTEVIAATGHNPSSWIIDKAATCTADGRKHKQCTACATVLDSETTPASGHSFTNEVTAATCTSVGYETKTCRSCGECHFVRVIPAKGHTPSGWKTDSVREIRYKDCTVCGELLEAEKITECVHRFVSEVTDPTCTANGFELKTCADCGETRFVRVIAAKGHALKTTVTPATQNESGLSVTSCKVCGMITKATLIKRVASVALSKTAFTYNGKVQTPTVIVKDSSGKVLKRNADYTVSHAAGRKNPGQYSVKVTFKGDYSGTKTLTFTIAPGTPTLTATAGAKKATLKWNKQTGATGYVVYMATSKSGKYTKATTLKGNSKVSYTKTGLTKGKTYYFKVCAYTTVGGKTVYGAASAVKAVKVK